MVTEGLFLDLASKWKWLEALPALHISSTGSHVIVYDKTTKVILASALIQDISRKKNWLIKTPFFLQPIWGRKVNSPDFSQEQDDFTDALGIPRLKREWDSIDEFENAVTDKVGEDK